MTDTQTNPTQTPEPQTTPAAPVMPVVPPQTPAPVTTQPHPKPSLNMRMVAAVGGILLVSILVVSVLYARSVAPSKEEIPVPVTPTAIPTPTPLPNLSRISSSSAFMQFSSEVASFAAVLNAFTLRDASLTPPTLDPDLDLN